MVDARSIPLPKPPAKPSGLEVDMNNWHTVSAINFKDVNGAIKNQHSSPKSFSGNFDDPFDGDIVVAGGFGDWQLNGGSGNLVHMKLPFPSATATPKRTGKAIPLGSGYGQIEIDLKYIPQPGDTNQQDLRVDASKAVQSVAVFLDDSAKANFAPTIGAVLTTWLKDNLQKFNHVFAVANLGAEETSPAFKWLKPTKVGYAIEASLGVSVDDYVFGVLGWTGKIPAHLPPLPLQVSPNAIPAGRNGGFIISFDKFLTNIFMPGVYKLFKNASAADFDITSDGKQVHNTKQLTFQDLEVPTNKSGTQTRKVTDATIDANKFTLTAFPTYLELQFNNLFFTFHPGYIAHCTYSGFQKLGVVTSSKGNHFKFTQAQKPVLNITIVETTGEKWADIIDSILLGVGLAFLGAALGGALGPAVEGAEEATDEAVSEAAEDAEEGASSLDFDVPTVEDTDIENLDQLDSEDAEESSEDVANEDNLSYAQKFKGFFRRNWTKMLGMAIGGAAGAALGQLPNILETMSEGDLTKLPTLNQFAEEAVAPVVFTNTKSFALKSVELNGAVQMGLDVTFDS